MKHTFEKTKNFLRYSLLYGKHTLLYSIRQRSLNIIRQTIADYPVWLTFQMSGESTISSSRPWFCFSATNRVKELATPEKVVFEYGSGGSTLFWSQHCDRVFSVEHDMQWAEQLKECINQREVRNVTYFPIKPPVSERLLDYRNSLHYASNAPQWRNHSFEEYVKVIHQFDDHFFDIIVVDGRARNACVEASLSKLKPGGYLIVDNSERPYYLEEFLSNPLHKAWKSEVYEGIPVMQFGCTQTTIFQKPL